MRKKSDQKSKDAFNKKKLEALNLKENPCATANCSALCLLSPVAPYFKCDCPDNFYLGKDSKTCIANCTAAQFLCKKSMKCILFFWKCDGHADCEFNEDEPEKCLPFFCQHGEFQCDAATEANATCLDPISICDGTKQCNDGTDEANCETSGCFIGSQFQCKKTVNTSAYCIPEAKKCDNIIDCPSGNDEKNCPPRTCSTNDFKCESNELCIPKVWQCDGDADCLDGSDEKKCKDRKCFVNEFKCPNGRCIFNFITQELCIYVVYCYYVLFRCIPMNWICDEEADCPDGSDEGAKASCDTLPARNSCDPTYFK